MSDNITPPPVPPTPSALPTPPPAAKPASGKLALAALVLGIVAIVCAAIPGLSFVAFLPAFAALILGIVALATKAPGRGKALTGVILGPIALLVAIIVSVSAIATGFGSTADQAKPAPAATAPATAATSEPAEAEPAEAPVEEGTRQNPAPLGSVIEISDNSGPIWQVQIGAANLNAGDVIAAENQFNDAADAGFQYVLVPVTYTYVGSTSGTPWINIQVEFVAAAGTTHTQEFAVIPNSVTDINEMYNGATATGNVLVMAPTADIEKGSWAISTFFGTPYFVKVV